MNARMTHAGHEIKSFLSELRAKPVEPADQMIEAKLEREYAAWLDAAEIRYSPRANLTGKSGCDHHCGFVTPKSNKQPERESPRAELAA